MKRSIERRDLRVKFSGYHRGPYDLDFSRDLEIRSAGDELPRESAAGHENVSVACVPSMLVMRSEKLPFPKPPLSSPTLRI